MLKGLLIESSSVAVRQAKLEPSMVRLSPRLFEPKQIAQTRLILNGHMQVSARNADVRVPYRIPHLGERSSTG